jgi:hypothetical protein
VINESAISGMEPTQGDPDVLENWNPFIVMSRKKAQNIFGIEFKLAEKTIRDLVADVIRAGWTK